MVGLGHRGGRVHAVAGIGQAALHDAAQHGIVFDYEDAHGQKAEGKAKGGGDNGVRRGTRRCAEPALCPGRHGHGRSGQAVVRLGGG
ncbi:hypothetical protein Acidovoranil_12220 [Acidovorax sp. FG27]